ncbi:MAG: rod shape-determining protein [Patescibacteria group bacterium]
MFDKFFGRFSRDIGIDLGTSNTLIYVKDKGIVINEPSVVAINARTEQILSVGKEAREMVGKTPPHLIISHPLNHGIIADYEVTEKMLRYFIERVHEESFTLMPRPRVVIGTPLEITEVERKAIEDATLSAGARTVALVEAPMAAAIGARMPIQEAVGNFIIDIGGGTTEIATISLGGIVTWKSIRIAGREMDKNIIQYARDAFNILIGERYAEKIKIQAGSALPLKESIAYPIRGRDLITGLPKEVMATDAQIRDALARSITAIVESVKATMEMTPPELIADIHERGILLTGGGALLRGIDRVITNATGIPVRMADDPLTCVVRGTGILLDDEALLREVTLPSARDV